MIYKTGTLEHCYCNEKNLNRVIQHFRSKYRVKNIISYGKEFNFYSLKGNKRIVSYKKNVKTGEYFVFVNFYKEVERCQE